MDQTIIIGLGNPDPALEETYHNAGALAVQWMAEHAADGDATPKFRAHKGSFAYVKTGHYIFVRPLVYMNESGKAVSDAMRAFDVDAKHIVVVHDDSDIPIGEFKSVTGGGSAGHNGIRSIIDHLHTEDFTRIRIGIREKDEVHRKKAGDFVLSPISPANRKVLENVFESISSSFFS